MSAVTLFLCGDVMTGRGIDQILPVPSSPELFEPSVRDARDYVMLAEERSGPIPRAVAFDYVWGDALVELRRVAPDARIVNLETSVTRSDDVVWWKGINYRMHPANVGCLLAAGVDVCVLANNHVLDWGERGLRETLDVLRRAGIRTAGAGTTEVAVAPAIVPVRDARVVVFGLGHGSSGIPRSWRAQPEEAGVWLLDDLSEESAEAVGELAQRARAPGDVVVVSIHWGTNWGYEVTDAQVRFARALVDHGIDVVHGHSSHHPRPIETYAGRLILYGCGDFVNDYEGIAGHEAYRADLALAYVAEIDPASGRLSRLRMIPLRLSRMRLERASAVDTRWLRARLERVSRPFGTVVGISGEDGVLELAPEPLLVQVPPSAT
ncbi:MAG: CapA family protein [Labilithrix sp.]|nr:CapA family protein [Labilithrix sp.]